MVRIVAKPEFHPFIEFMVPPFIQQVEALLCATKGTGNLWSLP